VRGLTHSSTDVLISGSLKPSSGDGLVGLLYTGNLANTGVWSQLTYGNGTDSTVTNTSCYGPADCGDGTVQIVGSYKRTATGSSALGFVYHGPSTGGGVWRTITPSADAKNTYVHSTMGGRYAVGNYDTTLTDGYAFIADLVPFVPTCTPLVFPGSRITTVYGIWDNGNDHYTLIGGASHTQGDHEVSHGYLCDWTPSGGATNWTAVSFPHAAITHFEGISKSHGHTGTAYSVSCNYAGLRAEGAALLTIERNAKGAFVHPHFTTYAYPGGKMTTNDCVWGKVCLGVTTQDGTPISYAATIG